jgi:hypothetical protein
MRQIIVKVMVKALVRVHACDWSQGHNMDRVMVKVTPWTGQWVKCMTNQGIVMVNGRNSDARACQEALW